MLLVAAGQIYAERCTLMHNASQFRSHSRIGFEITIPEPLHVPQCTSLLAINPNPKYKPVFGFQNFKKVHKKRSHQKCHLSTNKAKVTMLRAELTPTCTAGIDTSHSTRFTILLVSCIQSYMWTKRIWFKWQNGPRRAFAAGSK